MVNARSILLGCALALSSAALPVEQQQAADCHKTMTAVSKVSPTAAPQASTASAPSTGTASKSLTPAMLIAMAPLTASCTAAFAQCADATRAAPAISKSFEKYGFKTPGEQAALIAIMLFESDNFKYNQPIAAVAGKGTRNMQSEAFNKKYAADLKGGAVTGDLMSVVNASDDTSFGSAAWFLKTQCDASIAKGLQSGSMAGWDTYLTQCIGTTHAPARDVSWTAAKKALGV
jgi:hypothetical protein